MPNWCDTRNQETPDPISSIGPTALRANSRRPVGAAGLSDFPGFLTRR